MTAYDHRYISKKRASHLALRVVPAPPARAVDEPEPKGPRHAGQTMTIWGARLGKGYFERRRAVCRRCHCVLDDIEPMHPGPEYFHPREARDGKPRRCANAGHRFHDGDKEIVPFVRKSDRRAITRTGRAGRPKEKTDG